MKIKKISVLFYCGVLIMSTQDVFSSGYTGYIQGSDKENTQPNHGLEATLGVVVQGDEWTDTGWHAQGEDVAVGIVVFPVQEDGFSRDVLEDHRREDMGFDGLYSGTGVIGLDIGASVQHFEEPHRGGDHPVARNPLAPCSVNRKHVEFPVPQGENNRIPRNHAEDFFF